jgi:isochorismate synthase
VTDGRAEPLFALRGRTGAVLAYGVRAAYPDIAEARAALHAASVPMILGALPFDVNSPAALQVPEVVRFAEALPPWPAAPMPTVHAVDTLPCPAQHRARVAAAVETLNAQGAVLQKVVLARSMVLSADAPWDARTVLSRLVAADPAANVYLADLSTAGGGYQGTALVGASPELLVARDGAKVICRPFAGSAPRSADPDLDRAAGAALAESGKNRHEHRLVVEVIRNALEPLCADLQIAAEPELHHTDALWHLSTPIVGRLRESSTTALDLALALHPTPAVGGVPADAAAALIHDLEGDRGFYAGAVGWCDARGDGRWVVSIRCAQLSADRRTALAHSGGGIVAESDPDDEVDETTTKFKTILTGLGAAT